jgi:hypothetical protein
MGILEKLRAPAWKHADPAVRAAALYDLGPNDGDALRSVVREDPEARVRRAAVARVEDADLLVEVAASDPDDDVRTEAVRGLSGLAVEADDPARATALARQLLALGRTKEVVATARDNAHSAVREAIVDLLEDAKPLGAVSRHARDGATRLRALARLSDPSELLNVAIKSKHTDVAVMALDQLEGAEVLGDVAQHARSKVAARRARVRLRAIENPGVATSGATGAPLSATAQARITELQGSVDALVAVSDLVSASAALATTRLLWAEFQAEVVELDPAVVERFEAGSDAVLEAIAARERERDAERARAEAAEREQADRLAICEAIEVLSGADAEDRIAELKVAWDELDPMPSEYAARLTRRFQDACRSFGERERHRALVVAAAARLGTLADELDHLVASSQPLEELVARWRGLRRDADVLLGYAAENPEAGERLARAIAALEDKERQHEEARTKREKNSLKRLHQLCRHVEGLAASEALTLKSGERALKEIKGALDSRVDLPSKRDHQEIRTRLEQTRTALGPRVQELREADEWQRWANLQVQEELCREMEALREEAALDVVSRRMKELQARWKPVALAPRAQGDALWRRFKAAQDEVFAKTSSYFSEQREARLANLARKDTLCAQAEGLADSTDWVKTATTLQRLQAEWKAIGPVPRGREKAVWERFRGACDRFFTSRQEVLKGRKEEWNANLAKKVEFCVRAEELADSSEWDAAAAELKALQAVWKATGPVRRSKSEVIWHRFRGACDRFFERYKHRDQLELQDRVKAREQVISDLKALLPQDPAVAGDAPDHLYQTITDARTRWQQVPDLPRPLGQELAARYHDAIGRLVTLWPGAFANTDLDPEATRRRMEKLIARVEALGPSAAPPPTALSLTELLAQQLRERLAANTMSGAARSTELEAANHRALEQEIRTAQAQWARLGPVAPDIVAPLHERFLRACRQVQGKRRQAS